MFPLSQRGETNFDLAFLGKTAGFGLGKDNLAVDHHVELASRAGLDLDLLAEAALQLCGQTGRARLIVSNNAVEDLGCHG
jgi:hypothetical protein